jgi:hypothetical protein
MQGQGGGLPLGYIFHIVFAGEYQGCLAASCSMNGVLCVFTDDVV